eukprot:SAG22_NODE_84_length_21617_cov_48.600102_16_plen_187_part_00
MIFADTRRDTPDKFALVDPPNNNVDLARMTACPAVRWFAGWYYVATTTEGAPCLPAGWEPNAKSTLCVLLFRSKTLAKGSWVLGNSGKPIVQPADSGPNNDRKVMAPFEPTAAQEAAIHGHAPQHDGNINNSDFDFCDAPELGGVFGLWAGIANQQSNPYFNIGGVAKVQPAGGKSASQVWLESFF